MYYILTLVVGVWWPHGIVEYAADGVFLSWNISYGEIDIREIRQRLVSVQQRCDPAPS